MALLSALESEIAIPVCAVIGIAFSLVLWCLRLRKPSTFSPSGVKGNCDDITSAVYEGVKSFLGKEYRYVAAFVGAFAILIFLCLGSVEKFSTQSRPCKFDPSNTCKPALATAVFSTVSFLLGAFTSVISGFIGTKIAIYANKRTVFEENFVQRTSIAASRSSAVMGFLLAAIGLLILYLAIYLFKLYYGNDWEGLFEAVAGYGLGGSFMALFRRAGGGIYAKAADVCNHLVKENMTNVAKDDRNPAVIPNYVGDILGDIAGMGPDLFASYAGSSCAALVVASISSFGIDHNFTAMCYPLLISSMGILVCLITTLLGEIMPGLKTQLIISTILMTGGIFFVSWVALPSSFTIYSFESQKVVKVVKYWQLSLCVSVGLWAGLIIGFVNEIDTNNIFSCLGNVAGNSVSVSLGSVSIPIFAGVSTLVSSSFAGAYGIAVAALGMLSTIATRLAIDAYGPISRNAEGIAGTAGWKGKNSQGIDAHDAASTAGRKGKNRQGITTATTGKEFPIESAALVSIALFGAFISRPAMSSDDVLTPKIIIGLIMGAWLPHCFSAMTMKSVGRAVFEMALEVRKKSKSGDNLRGLGDGLKYYAPLLNISTYASVRGMIVPGAIVMLTPLVVGTVLGVETLSGVLAGSLGSVVQIAISASNTGEAWKKPNELIRDGARVASEDSRKGTSGEIAESGETIDDLQKDTSSKMIKLVEIVRTICHSQKDTSGEIVQSGETSGDSGKDTPGVIVGIAESGVTTGDPRQGTSGEIVLAGETTDDSGSDTPGGSVKTAGSGETTGDSRKVTSSELDEIIKSIGDSQKDTSGPPLNILIQLMAVESLVFAPFFASHGGLLFKIL